MLVKEEIVKKALAIADAVWKGEGFGPILNYLQDIVEEALTEKEFEKYLIKSNTDVDRCAGNDGLLLNGHYFDWKVFDSKKKEIIEAWLGYFSEASLKKINNKIAPQQ